MPPTAGSARGLGPSGQTFGHTVTRRRAHISFGKTYVNITLRPEDDADDATLTETDHAFAAAIDGLID